MCILRAEKKMITLQKSKSSAAVASVSWEKVITNGKQYFLLFYMHQFVYLIFKDKHEIQKLNSKYTKYY